MKFNDFNSILPMCVDNTKFNYLKVDDIYISSLIIINYPSYSNFLEIVSSFPKNMMYDLTINIKKQDTVKVLRELTYAISLFGSEIKSINKNQIDIELLGKNKEDALDLRKEIQINGEEVFFVSVIVTLFDENKELLLKNLHNLRAKLYSKGMICNMANFRQLDSYILSLPYIVDHSKLLELTCRNFTTSALANQFPFISNSLFDKNGILFGFFKDGNNICNIDIFDNKYLNSNMCIFGESGAGKSFFIKLIIIRNYLASNAQFIFDIEGEYEIISKNLNIPYINFYNKDCKYFFNIFQIYEYEITLYGNNVLLYKIEKLTNFFTKFISDCDETRKIEIRESIRKTYIDFNIISINDLYKKSTTNNIFLENIIIESNGFPTIIDFLENISSNYIKESINKEVLTKFPAISSVTNFDVSKKFDNGIVFGLKGLDDKNITIFTDFCLDIINVYMDSNIKLKKNINTIIYFDEIWRFLSNEKDKILSFKIFELFKTIRKKRASIISITQDISDFFLYDNKNFGKSILNNSSFKMFFKLEYEDIELLEKFHIINNKSLKIISNLQKGQAMLFLNNSYIIINIKANDYEIKVLGENENEDFSCIK